jgi:hypothetical protein
MTISASWELGFSQYVIVGMEGNSKNLEDSKLLITDPEEIEANKKYLTAFGGSGKLNGLSIYRQPTYDALPLGIGLTETPAADVKGIAVEEPETVANITTTASVDKVENSSKTISQPINKDVKENRTIMKLKSVADINEESWKELTASVVKDFILEEVSKANEAWKADKAAKEKDLSDAKASEAQIKATLEETKKTLGEVQANLTKLQAEASAKAKEESFNQRMASLDGIYDLTVDDRKVIASAVQDMDDKAFTSYASSLAVLLKEKSKEYKKTLAAKTEVTASTTTEVIETAVETAVADKETVAVTSSGTPSYKDLAAKAFAETEYSIATS